MATPDSARSPPGFPVGRIAGWQLLATVAIAAIAGWWAGLHGALSALLGGLVNITAGVVYAVVVGLRRAPSAGDTVRTMIRAEAAKITLIVLQLWLVLTTYRDVVPAALLAAFVVTVVVWTAAIVIRD
ncbi:MAG TPA: ATP synthase subunit I [Casimicrobiaceae bacterium]|nr:ATP synthase subunit I [Casimicrobiaceae bacterium]